MLKAFLLKYKRFSSIQIQKKIQYYKININSSYLNDLGRMKIRVLKRK